MPNSDIAVIAGEFCPGEIVEIKEITDGAINTTYEVSFKNAQSREDRFILQSMSAIFAPEILVTLDNIRPLCEAERVVIPHCLKTNTGKSYVEGESGRWWRALSYLPGITIHDKMNENRARSAGELVGKFHSALADFSDPINDPIPHFHDTPFIMEKLSRVALANQGEDKQVALAPMADQILSLYKDCQIDISNLPRRVIHADLKVSNIRFSDSDEALSLIDMDTVMRHSVVVEMGDALRSWCGTEGEDSALQTFDEQVCISALEGYLSTANFLTNSEREGLVEGISLLTLELSARFLTDAYEESYFALSRKYSSLYEQNSTRARNQLAFLEAFEAKRHLININI